MIHYVTIMLKIVHFLTYI